MAIMAILIMGISGFYWLQQWQLENFRLSILMEKPRTHFAIMVTINHQGQLCVTIFSKKV